MRPTHDQSRPAIAILTLAVIKAATEAFDRGESNVHDVLEAVTVAIEAHRVAIDRRSQREQRERDVA